MVVAVALAGSRGASAGRGGGMAASRGRRVSSSTRRGGANGGRGGRKGPGSSSGAGGRGGGRGGRGGRGRGDGDGDGGDASSSSSKYHGPAARFLEASDARAAASAAEAARRARARDERAMREVISSVEARVGGRGSEIDIVPFEEAAAALSLGVAGGDASSSDARKRTTRSRGARKDADRLYLRAHRASFGAALDAELREEATATAARLRQWPRARLSAEGCALFGLSPAPDGGLYGDVIVRLSLPGGNKLLPYHAFAPGDNVLLSRGNDAAVGGDDDESGGGGLPSSPSSSSSILSNHGGSEGIVLDYSKSWIRVALAPGAARTVLPSSSPSSRGGGGGGSPLLRLDLFGNTTAHDRCVAALDSFASPPAATGDAAEQATLRRALTGIPRGVSSSAAAAAPRWATSRGDGTRAALRAAALELASQRYSLNASQVAAGRAALTRTLTLWQGPPGTGKTRALAALVDAAARSGVFDDRGGGGSGSDAGSRSPSSSPSRPILVCAASNVAVDNIILALLKLQGLDADGVGRGGERQRRERFGGSGSATSSFRGSGTSSFRGSGTSSFRGSSGSESDFRGDSDSDRGGASSEREQQREQRRRRQHLQPLRIVRLGPPAKASAAVRHLSLAALAAAVPAGKAAAAARASAASMPPGALGRAARERAAQLEEESRRIVISGAHVVACTAVGAGDDETFAPLLAAPPSPSSASGGISFPFVAVDEATQATEPAALVPLILRRATAALLVGDPRQLPPTVVSREAVAAGLGVSLFERLSRGAASAATPEEERGGSREREGRADPDSAAIAPYLLDLQYRMHPSLSLYPSLRWYSGKLRDGVAESERVPPRGVDWPVDATRGRGERRHGDGGEGAASSSSSWSSSPSSSSSPLRAPPLLPVLFIPCDAPEQRCGFGGERGSAGIGEGGVPSGFAPPSTSSGTTFRNDGEAAVVLSVVSRLVAAGDVAPSDVGVITPYAGQARALRSALDLGFSSSPPPPSSSSPSSGSTSAVEVRTVDGFQGREKAVVVFSAVRSNDRGAVGFLSDARRLNVALTRAKRGLVVVGNPRTLSADEEWRAWLDWWRGAAVVEGGGGGTSW